MMMACQGAAVMGTEVAVEGAVGSDYSDGWWQARNSSWASWASPGYGGLLHDSPQEVQLHNALRCCMSVDKRPRFAACAALPLRWAASLLAGQHGLWRGSCRTLLLLRGGRWRRLQCMNPIFSRVSENRLQKDPTTAHRFAMVRSYPHESGPSHQNWVPKREWARPVLG